MTAPEVSLRPAIADDCEFACRTTRDYQRRGIGSHLIERLLAEARSARLPLRLRVLRLDPACALYQRMGFKIVEETPERYFIEHSP